jgi:hypothetical protein
MTQALKPRDTTSSQQLFWPRIPSLWQWLKKSLVRSLRWAESHIKYCSTLNHVLGVCLRGWEIRWDMQIDRFYICVCPHWLHVSICSHRHIHTGLTVIYFTSFSTERAALIRARNLLRHAAGNIYYNEKCTGAVVGQQPFGGSRASGTNDKAGSISIFYRFVSARSIKEGFTELGEFIYPSNLIWRFILEWP